MHKINDNMSLYSGGNVKENFDKNYNFMKPKNCLKIEIVENAIIMPFRAPDFGGVFTHDHKLVELSITSNSNFLENRNSDIFYSWGGKFDEELIKSEKLQYIDEEVVHIGPIHGSYGLFLLETLSRMWFFLNDENKKYKITYTDGADNSDYWFKFFELLGLKKEQFVKIEKPVSFKKVIIPEQSFRLSDYMAPEFLDVFNAIKKDVPAAKYEKIYFSKTKWVASTSVFGEKAIEQIFKKNGYKIFYPEKLSIKEQISLLKGCKKFAGIAGTNTHNNLFAADGIECYYLMRTPDICSPQILIDKNKNFKVSYIESFIDIFPTLTTGMPCLVGPTQYLIDFFNDNNFKYSYKTFFRDANKNLWEFIKNYIAYAPNHKTYGGDNYFVDNKLSIREFAGNFNNLLSIYPIGIFENKLGKTTKKIRKTISILGIKISYKKKVK